MNLENGNKNKNKSLEYYMEKLKIDRRFFLKFLGVLSLSLVLPPDLKNYINSDPNRLDETIKNTEKEKIKKFIENMEKEIIRRGDWDIFWEEIKKQYSLKTGEKFVLNINGKKRKMIAKVLSYEQISKIENTNLKLEDYLDYIVIHHTGIEVNKDAIVELNATRNHHIEKRNFNDIAYHFLIDKQGKIYEGRPIDFLGAHAGSTKETKEIIEKKLNDLESLDPNNNDYEEKLKLFLEAEKKNPDFKTIGICLFGNFKNENKPNYKQLESVKNLLNYLKLKYNISKDNIIGHRDVHERIIKKQGYKKISADKKGCPGFDVELDNLYDDTVYDLLNN